MARQAKIQSKQSLFKRMAFCTVAGIAVGFSAKEVAFSDHSSQLPKPQFQLPKENFVVHYDGRLKQPAYVYEIVKAKHLSGDAKRAGISFKTDDSLPHQIRATHEDYRGSGYDRGHLSPAANHKNSKNAMKESFLYSNISPQTPQFNRGYWKKVEKLVQDLALQYGEVAAITGPLFLPKKETNGKSYVRYEVIGEQAVAAPTHFFKVISTPTFTKAYILQNGHIDAAVDLETFSVPLDRVERAAGIIFSQS